MNRWAAYLAATPASLQRLIAATQRVSLPRSCTPTERLARLRAALCRASAVRATYFALDPAEQRAVQELRHARHGLHPDTLTARFGPIRPLDQLRADRIPRSISERLLLLGWLLPRPAARNHPRRYLLAPELRAWLPSPMPATSHAMLSDWPVDIPALDAATTLLAACAVAPLPLRRDGRPTAATLRLLRLRLAPLPPAEADALCIWLLPLLGDLALLAPHGAAVLPGPAAARFLAAPPAERLRTLRDAWIRAPRPDSWLASLRVCKRGLDWPAFRRRLLVWAAALPTTPTAPADAYPLLSNALGPLADAYTHGFAAHPRRSPWLPRSATAVWASACRGPLRWLAALPVPAPDFAPDPASPGSQQLSPPPQHPSPDTVSPAWRITDGAVIVPPGVAPVDLLDLAPFASWVGRNEEGDHYALNAASVAAATARGYDPARLRTLLARHCETIPSELAAVLAPGDSLRMVSQTVLLSDHPSELQHALRRRSVRRAVETVLAPGVALVAPGSEAALTRALARDGRAIAPPIAPIAPPPAALSPAEQASLLIAVAHYRATAPSGSPPGPHDVLLNRLRAALPPALAAATDAAITRLRTPERRSTTTPSDAEPTSERVAPAPLPPLLDLLRPAIRRRRAVTLRYQGADDLVPRERTVRPLRLERHGPCWYLHAFCLLARAERCFRLDRVYSAAPEAMPPRPVGAPPPVVVPPPPARTRRDRQTASFFAGPPHASPLSRVWLSEDGPPAPLHEIVVRLGSDTADAVDCDPFDGVGVEAVAAHTVGVQIDQFVQLAPDLRKLGAVEHALEHAVLDAGTVALEQLHDLRAPLVAHDVVADDGEHDLLRCAKRVETLRP